MSRRQRVCLCVLCFVASAGCRAGSDAVAAAGGVKPAAIPAQTAQAFTLAVPLQVEIMTNVAVRAE